MTPRRTATALVALRGQWLTARELSAQAGMSRLDTCQKWLRELTALGVTKARHRPKAMKEDGNKPPGHCPREYTLARQSEWGKL